MERRLFLRNLLMGMMIGMTEQLGQKSYAQLETSKDLTKKVELDKKIINLMKEIYKEVKELGKYNEENYINREFHLDLDGNEINSEEHVNVLIYASGGRERVVLQVTYFEPENRVIKYAKETRSIICYIKGEKVEVEKCEYNEKQLKSLLPDILKEIKYEKELLKRIDRKN
jgi:hypothetical protein